MTAAATYLPAQHRLTRRAVYTAIIIITAAITLIALAFVSQTIHRFFYSPDDFKLLLPVPAAAIVGACFWRVRYAEFVPMARVALRRPLPGCWLFSCSRRLSSPLPTTTPRLR